AAVLVLVGHGEGDLGAVAVVPHEARDRSGLRVALDVADERVSARVDRRQLLELRGREAGLRPHEAGPPGALAEAGEGGGDRRDVARGERADEELGAVPWLDEAGIHVSWKNLL